MDIDTERLTQHFQEMSTDDLIRILHIDTDEYLAEGKEFAVRELKNRGIDAYAGSTLASVENIRLKVIAERAQKQTEEASKPLSAANKRILTCMPGIALWVYTFTPKEHIQRKKDAFNCWWRGILLWAVVILSGAVILGLMIRFL